MFWIGLILGVYIGVAIMAVFTVSSRGDDDGNN